MRILSFILLATLVPVMFAAVVAAEGRCTVSSSDAVGADTFVTPALSPVSSTLAPDLLAMPKGALHTVHHDTGTAAAAVPTAFHASLASVLPVATPATAHPVDEAAGAPPRVADSECAGAALPAGVFLDARLRHGVGASPTPTDSVNGVIITVSSVDSLLDAVDNNMTTRMGGRNKLEDAETVSRSSSVCVARTLCLAGMPAGGWHPCSSPSSSISPVAVVCAALDGAPLRGYTSMIPTGHVAPAWTCLFPTATMVGSGARLDGTALWRSPAPSGERVMNATRPPTVAADGAASLTIALLLLSLLFSAARGHSTPSSAAALSAIALLATASATPTCTHVTASTGEGVTVCAPPWPRTPTDTPTSGTVVNIEFTMGSSGAGLSATSATVNGVDVVGSFSDHAGGLYTVTYATVADDTAWPWAGLEVSMALADGTTFSAVVVPGTTWSEESDLRGMAALANNDGEGLCMGDVDGDGDVDVFVAMNSGTVSQLWVNDGSGVFVDEAAPRGVAGVASDNAWGCGFGDADGDVWVDLVVTRWTNDVIELYMNDGGTFVEEGAARGVSVGDDSLGVSWGDVDGDGDVDLFVCSKRNRLFMNGGAGMFTEDGVGRGVGSLTRNSQQSALVDIDGDGDLDILVVNYAQANELYGNGGDGNFTEDGVSRGFADAVNGLGVSVGDWSGDGVVDAYVANYNSRDLLLLNGGSGVFSEVGVGAGIGASTGLTYSVMTFDIENDGDVDVVVGVRGVDNVWMNGGLGDFVDGSADLALGTTADTFGISAGDIDGDGDVDVIMGESGDVYVSHSAEGGVGRIIIVRPLTAGGAQSVFGAVVQVECVDGCEDGWVGVRVIDGGSSYSSQSGYDAMIGVPVPSATYNASVRWAGDFHPPSNWTTHPRLGGVAPSTLTSLEDRLFIVRPYPVTVTVGNPLPWDYPGVTTRTGEGAAPPTAGTVLEFPIVVYPWGSTVDLGVVSGSVSGRPSTPTLTMGLAGTGTVLFVIGEEDVDWPWGGVECSVTLADSGGLVSSNASMFSIPGTTWSEESDTRGMAALEDAHAGHGVCMGDVDGDGDVDVFAAMDSGTANQFWINDGSGVFAELGAARGVAGDESDSAHGCGFGDADGDGWVDLVVTRWTNDVIELYMNDGGTFVEDGEARGVSIGDISVGVSWGDVDGDGDVDLFVCGSNSKRNRLLINDGTGVFTEDGVGRGVGSLTRNSWQSALVDIDGDGDLDILVVNFGSANELYVNGGDGNFTEAGVSRGFADAGNGYGVSVGDWSGDGVVDVYVANYNSRDLLLLNDGSGVFSDVGVGAGIGASTGLSFGAATFDIENDGDIDVVVSVESGSDYVWVNDGLGGFEDGSADLALGTTPTTRGVSAGDIDGDGDVDVIMANSGSVYVSHAAEGGVKRSIMVRPLTAGGAQSAFGAVVWVECEDGCEDGWVGLRVIDGGSSYFSQSGYDAVVGVPVPFATYNISVRWAGDFHPPSNWTTHPRLGGIVPSTLPSAERVFIVRPLPVVIPVEARPWDYLGRGPSPPAADDQHSVRLLWANSWDVVLLFAGINGQNVTSSWSRDVNGSLSLIYVTEGGGEDWPWAGLDVVVRVVDSCGLVINVEATVIPWSTWSEESDERGMASLGAGSRSVCMGDVDGDGDVDVFVARSSGRVNQLWVNDGRGVFEDEGVAWGLAGEASGDEGCGFGDADGDGLLDLMVTRGFSDVIQLYMNTGGVFVEDGVGRGVGDGNRCSGVSWGDVDGDGDLDVFVNSDVSVYNRLYVNGGGGRFVEEGAPRGAASGLVTRQSFQSALADTDGDGDLDILVVNNGANELYVNNGTGWFEEAGVTQGFHDGNTGRGISVGDWSGDGFVDVYVSNANTRDLLYLNDGGGMFSEVGAARGVGAAIWNSLGVSMFDIEGDGDLDVVVAVDGGADMVWVNGGIGSFSDGGSDLKLGNLESAGFFVSAGDIDGDGDVDVVMPVAGAVYVNHNAQPGVPRVVVVQPLTAGGAQSAFGAVVRVECVGGCEEEWLGVRVIDGGSGFRSQAGYDAVVGVPIPPATYNISVRWAGGVHSPSNWTTHPRLGGVVPSTLTSGGSHLFVVRPHALVLTLEYTPPWDYPAVSTRSGQASSAPVAGQSLLLPIVLSPAHNTRDVNVSSAFVNGQDVTSSWSRDVNGSLSLAYVTEVGGEDWPWAGLDIVVRVVDSSGLVSEVIATVVPGSTWSEEEGARGMSGTNRQGVCMGDVDGDGDVDVFMATSGTLNHLWVNDGIGVFSDVAATWNVMGVASDDSYSCGFGDVDGDGLLDLMVTRSSSDVIELYMNTGGAFVEEGAGRGLGGVDDSLGLSWGDVDGDGDVDVFVCSDDTEVHELLMNDGAGVFTEEGASRGVSAIGWNSQQSAMADIDGDGDLDVLVVNNVQVSELYVNNGTGWFVEEGVARGFNDGSTAGQGISVGDWSGDGVVDVYISSLQTRDLLFLNDGSGVFSEVGVERGVGASTGKCRGVSMLDIEGDGDLDIVVVVDGGGGADLVWVNGGVGGFRDGSGDLGLSSEASETSVCTGDIDGDGDVDVVMSESGHVYVNHNARIGVPRVVVVRPLTAGGAQSAFGAVVRVGCVNGSDEVWVGVRVIDGGSGRWSQNGYDAVVGVPAPSATYNVSVRWPGDAWPVSNWTTHPRLGGITPSGLDAGSRLFVVHAVRWGLRTISVLPWDYAGVTVRAGLSPGGPTFSDEAVVAVTTSPPGAFLHVDAWLFDGAAVNHSLRAISVGAYEVAFQPGVVDWPWRSTNVTFKLSDSGGMYTATQTMVMVPGTTFSNSTVSAGVTPLLGWNSRGVCLGDVSGDILLDIMVVGLDGGHQLWVNSDKGVFVDEASEYGLGGAAPALSCAFGDANTDGSVDVWIGTVASADDLFCSVDGAFEVDEVPRSCSTTVAVVWGDADGDDVLDVYTCTASGPNFLYLNGGDGNYTEVATTSTGNCSQALFVDVNGDLLLDVVVINSDSRDELYVNTGDSVFAEVGVARGLASAASGMGAVLADMSGDGVMDVVVTADGGMSLLAYVSDGTGTFTEAQLGCGEGFTPSSTAAISAGDFDNDGDVDVMTGFSVWVNDGNQGCAFESAATLGLQLEEANALAAWDFDSDGDLDVLGSSAGLFTSHAVQPGVSNWLAIRPLSQRGAQTAFGTVVTMTCVAGCDARPWVAARVISSTGGYDALFGLPDGDERVYNVSVVWSNPIREPANWTTDDRLHGIRPAELAANHRVIIVGRRAEIRAIAPWDYGAVADRTGSDVRPPVATDTVTFVVDVFPPDENIEVVSAMVNGVDVVESAVGAGGDSGLYNITWVVGSDVEWPWAGVDVMVGVGLSPNSVQAEAVFVDKVYATVERRAVSTSPGDAASAMCVGDVSGDGDVDILVVWGGEPELWVGSSGGEYSDEHAKWGLGTFPAPPSVCAFGDVDGDDTLDLFVGFADTSTPNLLFVNNGTALLEQGADYGLGDLSVNGAAWGDVDGDGGLDLFVCGLQSPPRLFTNDNSGQLTDVWATWHASTDMRCGQAAFADVTGDGLLDVVTSDNSSLTLWVNVGGTFTPDVHGHGGSFALGQFDGDAGLEAFVVGADGEAAVEWAASGFRGLEGGVPGGPTSTALLDFDVDGDLDVFVSTQGGLDALLVTTDAAFSNSTVLYGLRQETVAYGALVVDADGDGDDDVLVTTSDGLAMYVNHNGRIELGNTLRVLALTGAGSPSEFGAVVTVSCANCGESWSASKPVLPTSSAVSFGLPHTGHVYNVSVAFTDGAVHDTVTQPALATVAGGSSTQVANRPFVTEVLVDPSVGIIILEETVTVTLVAGVGKTGLAAAEDVASCCFVNGVQVRDSFVEVGGGNYTLQYVPTLSDPEWEEDGLEVRVSLQTPGKLPMIERAFFPAAPPADLIPPLVQVDSGPAPFSASEEVGFDVSCPGEPACSFEYAVADVGKPLSPAITVTNVTTAINGSFVVGPFSLQGEISVSVRALDVAGNPSEDLGVTWVRDSIAPDTEFLRVLPPVTQRQEASFTLTCDEAVCEFSYLLDDALEWVVLVAGEGGNETVVDVGTEVVGVPDRVVGMGRVVLQAVVDVDVVGAVNVTLEVVLDGGETVIVEAVPGEVTDVVLDGLSEGRHVLTVRGDVNGDSDASPVVYVFVVDTVGPVIEFFEVPEDGLLENTVEVVFGAADDVDVFQWRSGARSEVAGVSWLNTTSGAVEVEGVGGEEHVVQVIGVDATGNVGDVGEVSWFPFIPPSFVPAVVIVGVADLGDSARLVTFEAVDDAGWTDFQYSVDGGEWVATTEKIVVVPDVTHGEPHTFAVRAAGGVESVVAWEDEVVGVGVGDGVGFVKTPGVESLDVFAEFTFSVTHSSLGVEYSLDGGVAWVPCELELVFGPLTPGSRMLSVRAVDGDGAAVGPVQHHTWTTRVTTGSDITFSGLLDGPHAVELRAVDAAGNPDTSPEAAMWRLDTVPPVTSANRSSGGVVASRWIRLEAGCGGEQDPCLHCWVSDLVEDGCSLNSTIAVKAAADGEVVVNVTAVDSAGNVDGSPVQLWWQVDTVAPDTDVVIASEGVFDVTHRVDVEYVSVSEVVTLALTPSEDGVAFEVGVDGGTVWAGNGTSMNVTLPDDNGVHAVTVTATDIAGNVEAEASVLLIMVDQEPPTTVIDSAPSLTAEPSVTVRVSGSDAAVGVVFISVTLGAEERLVDGASGEVVFDSLVPGEYAVTVVAEDGAGNVDPVGASATFVVDLIPPTSSFAVPIPPFTASPNLTVAVSASEPGDTFVQLVGASPWILTVGGMHTFTDLSDGEYEVELRSVDVAGNEELTPSQATRFVVDTVAPVLSWDDVRGVSEWSSASSVSALVSAVDNTPLNFTVTGGVLTQLTPVSARLAYNVTGEGQQVLNVTGEDSAGNRGQSIGLAWGVDRVPPATVVVADIAASSSDCVAGDDLVCPTASSARLHTVCDGGVGDVAPCHAQYAVSTLERVVEDTCVRRRLMGSGAVDAPTIPFALPVPGGEDGLFSVVVSSVDAAGNAEPGNTTLEWFVDSTPPIAPTVSTTAPPITIQRVALLTLQLVGDTSPGQTVFWYSFVGGPPTQVPDLPATTNTAVTVVIPDGGTQLPQGHYNVSVWAVDQLAREGLPTLYEWTVATTAPGIVLLESPATISGDSTPSFAIQAVWPAASFQDGVEPLAAIEGDLGEGFVRLCDNTVVTGGVCVWNITLPDPKTSTAAIRAVYGEVVGDPLTLGWEYRLCSDTEVAVLGENLAISCEGCPFGADCSGGLTSVDDVVAAPGFWSPPDAVVFYECPLDSSCVPGGFQTVDNTTSFSRHLCSAGHTGMLCAVCTDGYFQQFGRCANCGGAGAGVAWLITAILIVVAAVIGGLFFKFKEVLPVDQLKVALSFVQIIASANTAYRIPWPSVFAGFLDAMRVFLVEALSLTRANCAQPMTFYSSLVVTFVGFKLIVLCIVAIPALVGKLKARRRQGGNVAAAPAPSNARAAERRGAMQRRLSRRSSITAAVAVAAQATQSIDWAKIFKVTFLFLFVAYPGISLKIMQMFKCVEVEGQQWLVADMRLECYTGEWYSHATYAVIMGGLYTAGLPLAILVILVKNRGRLQESETLAKWGFLYEVYGVRAYLWEVEELVRKVILSALVVLMSDGSAMQVMTAVVVSGWAHVGHSVFKPWREANVDGLYTYVLQHAALFVTSFVFLMGLLFKVEGVSHGSATFNGLAWFMTLMCCAVLAAAMVLLVHSTRVKVGLRWRQQALGIRPGGNKAAQHQASPPWGDFTDVESPSRRGRKERAAAMQWVSNPLK